MKKRMKRTLSSMIIIGLLFSLFSPSFAAQIKPEYKPYVMAPLPKITDWTAFANQLEVLKNNGVHAITTDVWWGEVEATADNEFDWSYYKQYADVVRDSGLKWVPIISTHQCGGNVGDDCNVPLPNWIWNLASQDTLMQKSETGYFNKETLSPWATDIISIQYDELYASFAENFSDYQDIIDKIYLSAGGAGELRFSSYVPSDGWDYPSRGKFQAYSEIAKQDFRDNMQQKYITLQQVNQAWGTNLTSWEQISPPTDGDQFFTNGAAYHSTYGDDFLTWYQSVLIDHLNRIANLAHQHLGTTFDVPIGAKIAGIHWKMNDPSMPHSAEYSAGYYSYDTILEQFKDSNLSLTFTALEMDNNEANIAPYYSEPKTLVKTISSIANEKGISLNGENALAISSNDANYSMSRYQNIAQHLFTSDFDGFTLLRLGNIVTQNGQPTAEMARFKDTLIVAPIEVEFIVKNAPTSSGDRVYITGNRWELGMWNNPEGEMVELSFDTNHHDWRGKAYIAADRTYEFKAIIASPDDTITWEPGPNNNWHTTHQNTSYTIQW